MAIGVYLLCGWLPCVTSQVSNSSDIQTHDKSQPQTRHHCNIFTEISKKTLDIMLGCVPKARCAGRDQDTYHEHYWVIYPNILKSYIQRILNDLTL